MFGVYMHVVCALNTVANNQKAETAQAQTICGAARTAKASECGCTTSIVVNNTCKTAMVQVPLWPLLRYPLGLGRPLQIPRRRGGSEGGSPP